MAEWQEEEEEEEVSEELRQLASAKMQINQLAVIVAVSCINFAFLWSFCFFLLLSLFRVICDETPVDSVYNTTLTVDVSCAPGVAVKLESK